MLYNAIALRFARAQHVVLTAANYRLLRNETKQWVLILYDISQNHYVGIPVYSENKDNSVYLKSINKYAVLSEIDDYNRQALKGVFI